MSQHEWHIFTCKRFEEESIVKTHRNNAIVFTSQIYQHERNLCKMNYVKCECVCVWCIVCSSGVISGILKYESIEMQFDKESAHMRYQQKQNENIERRTWFVCCFFSRRARAWKICIQIRATCWFAAACFHACHSNLMHDSYRASGIFFPSQCIYVLFCNVHVLASQLHMPRRKLHSVYWMCLAKNLCSHVRTNARIAVVLWWRVFGFH